MLGKIEKILPRAGTALVIRLENGKCGLYINPSKLPNSNIGDSVICEVYNLRGKTFVYNLKFLPKKPLQHTQQNSTTQSRSYRVNGFPQEADPFTRLIYFFNRTEKRGIRLDSAWTLEFEKNEPQNVVVFRFKRNGFYWRYDGNVNLPIVEVSLPLNGFQTILADVLKRAEHDIDHALFSSFGRRVCDLLQEA